MNGSKTGNLLLESGNRRLGLQELGSLQHPVAPRMQQPVGCPILYNTIQYNIHPY